MGKIVFEELLWTCECGRPMGIEINREGGGWFDLDCSGCGLVGSVSIRPKGIRLAAPDCLTPAQPAPEDRDG